MHSCALPLRTQQGAATEENPCSATHAFICSPMLRPYLLSESINGLLALLQLLIASIYCHSKLGIALHTASAPPQALPEVSCMHNEQHFRWRAQGP